MSSLAYGPIVIERPCQVLSYINEPVFDGDGKTLLWQRHVIRVRGVYNPGTSLSFERVTIPGPPSRVPRGGVGAAGAAAVGAAAAGVVGRPSFPIGRRGFAPTTEKAIRLALKKPRQLLTYSVGGTEVLRSPGFLNGVNAGGATFPGGHFPCDANNGPIPTVHQVYPNHGNKSFVVDFSIETYVNDCVLETGAIINPLLSWRWNERHTIDQDFHSVRMIQGRAVFDQGRLKEIERRERRPVTADDYRGWLFGGHPPPDNFHRQDINVNENDAGNVIEYSIFDRERAIGIVPEGVTRVEAYETNQISTPGEDVFLKPLMGMLGGGAPGAIAPDKKGGIGAGAVAGAVANAVNQMIGWGRDAALGAVAMLPVTTSTIVARAWGHRDSTRQLLERTCFNIISARWGLPIGDALQPRGNEIPPAAIDIAITYDLAGKFVEVRATRVRGPLNNLRFGMSPLRAHPDHDRTEGPEARIVAPPPDLPQLIRDRVRDLLAGRLPVPALPGGRIVQILADPPLPAGRTIRALPGRDMPQNQDGSRGSYIGRMVAQALQQPCQKAGESSLASVADLRQDAADRNPDTEGPTANQAKARFGRF